MYSHTVEGLSDAQRSILKLAYERLLENQDLSLGEVMIVVYAGRPEKIGRTRVERLSPNRLVALCRSEPHWEFTFPNETEAKNFLRAQTSASEAVSDLLKQGLIVLIPTPNLVWDEARPVVKEVKNCDMIRLTERGRKAAEKRKHPRIPLKVAIEYSDPGSNVVHSGFTLDASQEGLAADLLHPSKVGQKLRLNLPSKSSPADPIEVLAEIVWVHPRRLSRRAYRSGMRITKVSPRNEFKTLLNTTMQ
jgi:hypothetical protein